MSDLQDQVGDMYTKMMNLIKVGEALEKEYTELKSQDLLMIEAAKQQIIAKYKASPELTEAVLGQFGEGYQNAKKRMKEMMLAAGLDPHILDFFDEESEAKDDHPQLLNINCTLSFLLLLNL